MKRYRNLFVFIICLSCTKNPSELIPHVNGYWEIQEALLSDGSKKSYDFNETIDYISINDSLKGFRKKLKPAFNNRYSTSESVEALTAKIENDSLNLYYSTPFSNWKETVLLANDEELKVKSENNTVYIYKRYQGIQLDLEE